MFQANFYRTLINASLNIFIRALYKCHFETPTYHLLRTRRALILFNQRWNDFESGWASLGKRRWSVVISKTRTKESNAKSGWATGPHGPHGSAATVFNTVLLKTGKALSPLTLYSDSALLVLNRTSLHSVSILLAPNWCAFWNIFEPESGFWKDGVIINYATLFWYTFIFQPPFRRYCWPVASSFPIKRHNAPARWQGFPLQSYW